MTSRNNQTKKSNESIAYSRFPCGELNFYDDTLESIDSSILFRALHHHFIGEYGPITKSQQKSNKAALGNTYSGEIISVHFDEKKKFMITTEIDGLDYETSVSMAEK